MISSSILSKEAARALQRVAVCCKVLTCGMTNRRLPKCYLFVKSMCVAVGLDLLQYGAVSHEPHTT